MAGVIPPLTITEAMLTSSTVAEPGVGETTWSSASAYYSGQRAILGAPTSTVTITIAAPGIVTWAAHGLPDGTPVVFTTTIALPTGITASTVYYVLASTLNTFQIAATAAGGAITTTGSQSGTQTATAQLHRVYESLAGVAATVTMTIASPCVVTHTAHGLSAGTAIAFTTTGALPTGLTANVVYYVLAPATNSYNVAATVGGSAINTSGSQSGVHTVISNPNVGHPPAIDDGTYWADVAPTSRWACFDTLQSTMTWGTSPMTIVITPGMRVDAMALLGLVADSITVGMTVSAVSVYSHTESLSTRSVADWYEYFFEPFTTKAKVLLLDLPPYTTAVTTITLTRTSGLVGIGDLVPGTFEYLGTAQAGAKRGRRNFTRITRDDFGTATVDRRRSIPTKDETIRFPKSSTKRVDALGELLNGLPAVWTSLDEDDSGFFEPFLLKALYTRFDIDADKPVDAFLYLQTEEV